MPFTPAHPALVLPLPKLLGRLVVLSALVIGSIAPDLPYFIGDPFKRRTTHTLASVLWFSLPVGWVVYLAFELALRRAAVFVLPEGFRARLRSGTSLQPVVPVTLSLLIGALSHIGWDLATHEAHAFQTAAGEAGLPEASIGGFSLLSYSVLQGASSLLGLAVVGIAIWRWRLRTPARTLPPASGPEQRVRKRARQLLLCIPPLVGVAYSAVALEPGGGLHGVVWFVMSTLMVGLGAAAGLLLLVGALFLGLGIGNDVGTGRSAQPRGTHAGRPPAGRSPDLANRARPG